MFTTNRIPMSDRIKNLRDYANHYHKSVTSPEKFWSEIAEQFDWKKKWDQVLNWDVETYRSIGSNAELNLTENILKRLLPTHKQNRHHMGAQ